MRATLQRTLGAIATVLALVHGAWAADATAEGAAKVRTDLARYLGADALTVTPAGGGYTVAIDLTAMLRGFARFGIALDPAVYTVTAIPESDGVWHVTSGGLPPLRFRHDGQTTSVVANGQAFDGTFDARIPSFTQWSGHYDSISVGVIGQGATTQAREVTNGEQSFTATTRADGVIDGMLKRTDAGFSQDIAIDNAKAHVDLTLKSGRTNDVAAFEGLHVGALAGLWAFLVAHPTPEAVKAEQPALRTLLRQALPVFDRVVQDGSLEGLTVRSPVGTFGAQHFAAKLDLHGLTGDGGAGLSLAADGLTLPAERLPAWSTPLMPTSVSLQAALSGYRLDEAAKAVVDTFDLDAPQPLPQATLDRLPGLIGPPDQMLVTIGDSRLTSPSLDARFGGTVRLTQPRPEIAVTVRATGLDETLAAIQAAAARDPSAVQAMTMLILIKGYGRAEPDGARTWAIAGDRDGNVTVNGLSLPGQHRN